MDCAWAGALLGRVFLLSRLAAGYDGYVQAAAGTH
jgi:hypothetical protein